MKKLSLLSISFVIALLLASCGGVSSIGGGRSAADKDGNGLIEIHNATELNNIGEGGRSAADKDGNGLIEIHNATELNNIRHNLAGTSYNDGTNAPSSTGCPSSGCNGYELADNINLSSITNFVPIGQLGNPFTATFEGNDYTISNLKIATDSTLYTGFFAVLGTSSTVRNLSFATGSVASSNNSGSTDYPNCVGVLAGRNIGTISGVSSDLSVFASTGENDSVGGLVGYNGSHFYDGGIIQDSYATGNAKGGAGHYDRVGGLVGYNVGTIGNSYATGNANGDAGADAAGGLVGFNNYGTIGNSYATGYAKGGAGNDSVGGLVGNHFIGTIGNSYATGYAKGGAGNDSVGGLVGYSYEGIIGNSYATGDAKGGAGNDSVGGLVGEISNSQHGYMSLDNSYALGNVNGGSGSDEVGRLLGTQHGFSSIIFTSNYYNSASALNGETITPLTAREALGKNSSSLKALTANNTKTDFGTGWDTKNWDFTNGKYPSLKSYQTEGTDADGNPIQIPGTLLCGQRAADFVQCP